MRDEPRIRYREKVVITADGRRHEFTFSDEKGSRGNSPTTTFWQDFRAEFFFPGGGGLRPLHSLMGVDSGGNQGGYTTNLSITASSTPTSMKLTVSAQFTWTSSLPLSRVVINCLDPAMGDEFPYFDATLPSPISTPPGSTVSVVYEVEVYVARATHTGSISGWTLDMKPLFDHALAKLTGGTTLKVYIHRLLLRNPPGTQSVVVPLDLDFSAGRAYRYNYPSPGRVSPVYTAVVQGTSAVGGTFNLMVYTAPGPEATFDVVEGQLISVDIRITTPA